jgi:PAS domain S-box-containing protein
MLLQGKRLSEPALGENEQNDDLINTILSTVSHDQQFLKWQASVNALCESEQRLKDFASASSDWFWETDAEGRFIWFSDNFEESFDISRQKYYGRKRQDIADTTINREHWQRYFDALEQRRPFKDIIFREHTEKGWCWNRISGVPIFNAHGNFQGFRGTGSDATQLYEAQSLAEQAKHRFIDAIEAFSDAYALFDAQNRLVICNRRFKEFNPGLTELIEPGMSFESLVRARLEHQFMVAAIGREELWLSERLQHFQNPRGLLELEQSDGSWLAIREERTQDGGMLFIVSDITERKRAEQALRQSEQRLELALTGANLGIWDWDIQSDRAVFDERWAEMLGYTLDEIQSRPGIWEDSIHPDDKAHARATISAQVEGKTTTTYELEHRLKTKTGEWKWILAHGRAMERDEYGRAIRMMGTHFDITGRKLAEQALRDSEQRFRDFAETAADWFWEMDENLHISYLSERYFELTGESAQSVLSLSSIATRRAPAAATWPRPWCRRSRSAHRTRRRRWRRSAKRC